MRLRHHKRLPVNVLRLVVIKDEQRLPSSAVGVGGRGARLLQLRLYPSTVERGRVLRTAL